MSNTVLEARAVITGEDRTGAMFASLEKKIAGLTRSSRAISDIPRNIEASARSVNRMSSSLTRSVAGSIGTGVAHGIRHAVAQTVLVGGPIAAAVAAAHEAVRKSAEYQHEKVALQNAGRTSSEMREINEASNAALKMLPTAGLAENLKVINETTGAFGSLHHAIENLPFMQMSASVLHAAAGDKIHESAGELGNKLARFFEMRGTAGDTPTFQREASEMMRAMIFTRGNFNPGEMLNFAQQAKAALPLYSERFLSRIVPSLVTEYGGDRAGTMANAFRSVLMGKVNDKKQAEEWMRYGLLDKSQVVMKAGHAVGWRAGAVVDTNKALSDPLQWMMEDLLPRMAAKGVAIGDKLELSKVLGTMFRNVNANAFAEALGQGMSQSRLLKDERNQNLTATPQEAYQRNLWTDPTVAAKAVVEAAGNLGAASGIMEGVAAPAMANLARGMQTVTRMMMGDHEAFGETAIARHMRSVGNYRKYGVYNEASSPEGVYKVIVDDAKKADEQIVAGMLRIAALKREIAEAERAGQARKLPALYGQLNAAKGELAANQTAAGRASALKGVYDSYMSEKGRQADRYRMGLEGPVGTGTGATGRSVGGRGMFGFGLGDYGHLPSTFEAGKAGASSAPLPPSRPGGIGTNDPNEGRRTSLDEALPNGKASPFGALPSPSGQVTAIVKDAVPVNVTGEATIISKVEVSASPQLVATIAAAERAASMPLRGNTGKSAPEAAPAGQLGRGSD